MKSLPSALCLLGLSLFLLLPGCSSPGLATLTYQPPAPLVVKNAELVEMPFDLAWDKLVKELATQFYVINNIDKSSRLINVSFSINAPKPYVTGGTSTRVFKRGSTNEETKYDLAESATYKTAWTWGEFHNLPVIGTWHRKTSLDGRANIYLAPEGENTRLTVNCRYILTVNLTGIYQAENAFGAVMQNGKCQESSNTASFNTNETCAEDWGTPDAPLSAEFRSTGKFESDVMAILAKKANGSP